MLSIYLPPRVFGSLEMRSFSIGLTDSSSVIWTAPFVVVFDTIHPLAIWTIIIAAKARSASSTTTRTFVVSCKRIPTGEATPTLIASMRPLPGVELGMPLQIMQSSESGLARLADIWLLLTVRQQVTLQIVVSRKVRGAIRAFVSLIGSGRLGTALAISG